MDKGLLKSIIIVVIGLIAVVSTVSTLAILLGRQYKASKQRHWLLDNGRLAKARIISVRDTKIRDSQDHFVLEVTIEVTAPYAETSPRIFTAPVSPLDFHRVSPGAEVAVRLHPDGTGVAFDLRAAHDGLPPSRPKS